MVESGFVRAIKHINSFVMNNNSVMFQEAIGVQGKHKQIDRGVRTFITCIKTKGEPFAMIGAFLVVD